MSQKAGGALGIIVGALAIIAAIPSGGASLTLLQFTSILAGGAMIAGGIYSLAFSPQAANQSLASKADLNIATSTEGFPIPVIFGRQRVNPNYMNYTKANFTSEELTQNAGKSDGGGSVVGHKYYLCWEMGYCMGPIDEVNQVIASPGEIMMRGTTPPTLNFGVDDYKEFTLSSTNEGGPVRLYKGSLTQNRIATGDPYYSGFANPVDTISASQSGNTVTLSQPILSGAYAGGQIQWPTVTTTIVSVINSNTCIVNGSAITRPLQNVTILPPTSLQTSSTMNYRGICWGLFGFTTPKFAIGLLPQPKTYQMILGRLPAHNTNFEMLRPDGTAITGFHVRGSSDSNHPNYNSANPAAAIYEIFTNQRWGRGMPQDLFNADSEATFVACAQFFYDHNIGMSFTLSSPEDLSDIIDGIRNHLKTIILMDGETIKLRCLLDIAQTHSNIKTLDRSKVGNVKFTRPDWTSTFNEIRAEFTNIDKNYRPDLVHVQDLANIQINGGQVNSHRIQLSGFVDFNTTRRQAWRMLRELSYPLGVLTFEMNRFQSRIEPGDCLRLIADDWSDVTVTAYFICTKVDKDKSDDEKISVSCVEDILLGSIEGTETSVTTPSSYPWEKIADLTKNQIGLFVPPSNTNGKVFPVRVFELPAMRTGGVEKLIILGQRPSSNVTAANLYWQNGSTWTLLGNQTQFSASGQLSGDWLTVYPTDRSASGFRFSLTDPSADGVAVVSANQVAETTDDLETLMDSDADYIIIGDEIMQVGLIEKLGTNDYRARNLIRGRFGTVIVPHYAGEQIWYLKSLPAGITGTSLGVVIRAQAFKVYPIGTAGETPIGDIFNIDGNGGLFVAAGRKPLDPILVSSIKNSPSIGVTDSFTVRPVFFNQGCEAQPFYHVMAVPISTLNGHSFVVFGDFGAFNSSYDVLNPTFTFFAENLSSTARGVERIDDVITMIPNPPDRFITSYSQYRIFSVYNNLLNVKPIVA